MDHIATEHPNFVPEVKKETKREKKKAQLPKVHECTFEGCDKSFAKISDYKRHYRIHTGERPYICEHCGASFNQRYRLTTHTRIHTGKNHSNANIVGKHLPEVMLCSLISFQFIEPKERHSNFRVLSVLFNSFLLSIF